MVALPPTKSESGRRVLTTIDGHIVSARVPQHGLYMADDAGCSGRCVLGSGRDRAGESQKRADGDQCTQMMDLRQGSLLFQHMGLMRKAARQCPGRLSHTYLRASALVRLCIMSIDGVHISAGPAAGIVDLHAPRPVDETRL
jgi:hypothetical protein